MGWMMDSVLDAKTKGAMGGGEGATDVGGEVQGGFTGSSEPSSPSGLKGYSDPADKPTSLAESNPEVVKYGQNIGGGPDAPKKSGFGDILKDVKGYTPGHGAPGIQMGAMQPVQTGQQDQQQSPQFSQLMDYIQKQKQGGI